MTTWNPNSPEERERRGQIVREAWVAWARTQPAPKPTWLTPWEELPEVDREADRQIADAVARDAVERALREVERRVHAVVSWRANPVTDETRWMSHHDMVFAEIRAMLRETEGSDAAPPAQPEKGRET